MATISSYRDLIVWQRSMDLATACYQTTKMFPSGEAFGLTAQIPRAAASVPANIGEGYGRQSKGAYVQSLRVSQGSLKELETHVLLAHRVEMLDRKSSDDILAMSEEVGKLLRSLIRALQAKSAQ